MGYLFGVWLFYALIAKFLKHLTAVIITVVIGIVIGISNCIVNNNLEPFICIVIAIILILFIPPIQINSEAKKEWKLSRLIKNDYNDKNLTDVLNDINENKQPLKSEDDIKKLNKELKISQKGSNSFDEETIVNEIICDEKVSEFNVKNQKENVFINNINDFVKKICVLEKVFIIFIISFLIVLFVFPSSVIIVCEEKTAEKNYKIVSLKTLDKYNETYFKEIETKDEIHYIIYQKVKGDIVCYDFIKSSSNYNIGCASKEGIVNYFENLQLAEPSACFICPTLFILTIILCCLSFGGAILGVVFFKVNEIKLYKYLLKDYIIFSSIQKNLIELENDFRDGLITEKDYKHNKKEYLSQIIGNKIKFLL